MTTQIVKAEDIKVVKNKITKMHELVSTVDVTDDAAVKTLVSGIKTTLDFLTGKKDALVDPAKAIIDEAKATYDPFINACKEAKVTLSGRVTAHVVEQQRLQKKEEDRIAAEAQKKKDLIDQQVAEGKITEEKASEKLQAVDEKATDKMAGVSEVGKTHGGINVRMVKKANIIDPSLVPDQYWIIDEVTVRKQALAGVVIPGVEVVEVPSGALTGR